MIKVTIVSPNLTITTYQPASKFCQDLDGRIVNVVLTKNILIQNYESELKIKGRLKYFSDTEYEVYPIDDEFYVLLDTQHGLYHHLQDAIDRPLTR